jgi:hypothetical protein
VVKAGQLQGFLEERFVGVHQRAVFYFLVFVLAFASNDGQYIDVWM